MKKKTKKDIFDFEYLDDEERELIESIENGEWKSLPKQEAKKKIIAMQKAAKQFMDSKTKVISLRLPIHMLNDLNTLANKHDVSLDVLVKILLDKEILRTRQNEKRK